MSFTPKISVILPVYNAEKYLSEAIQSILDQSYSDFEFIIINDGSKDRSEEIVLSFNDERIIYLSQSNRGLAATLNRGIETARGEYIARQDNDDVSDKRRLELQLSFMEEHPHVALLGTSAEIIDEEGQPTGRFHKHATDNELLKFFLLFDNPFVHSSVMFRKELVKQIGGYDISPKFFEDFNLWSRVARTEYKLANLPDCLLKYREVNTGMSKTTSDYRKRVKLQSAENIRYYCPELSEERIEMFNNIDAILEEGQSMDECRQLFRENLNILQTNFCKRENIDPSIILSAVNNLYVDFHRKYYNTIIYSPRFSGFQKLKAKIGRKLLFFKHRNILDS
jgi:glycosyltransferase involved in cell wall biosynthesis